LIPTHTPGFVHLTHFELDMLLQEKKDIVEIRLREVLGRVFRSLQSIKITIIVQD